MDAAKLVHGASVLGVDLVQIGDNYPINTSMEEELSALKALSDEKGIDLEIGTSGTDPAVLLDYLNVAKLLGARLIRSRVGRPGEPEDMETAQRNLAEVLGEYEKAEVLLALENYEHYSVHALAGLLSGVNSPVLGACIDTSNSLAALETPDIVSDALAPHALCLHIKDFRFVRVDYGLGYLVQGCPVGEGLLDVKKIIEHVRFSSRLKSMVLEEWTPYRGSVEETVVLQDRWAEKSIAYLKNFV